MNDARWQQISRIYYDAVALAPGERAIFLREACSDAALRAEIESLLAENSRAEQLLEPKEARLNRIGQRIGVYEIRSLLGMGGMGEVYRARDTKLDRDVAIKVLPFAFTSDPDRLARFEREARILATLNHPHIGAIHGFEDAPGVPALVLELVEGETLAERLSKGPILVSDALTIARQIADALEAAHEHGIVHRDLKPANIKITPGGSVKVLDFGLAKVTRPTGSPLETSALSHEGLIVGTVAYMSPEQARGMPVDKRADIWAFGCVLYEMLTGRPAFPGGTVSDTLAAVLDREPDWNAMPAATSPFVTRALEHCLSKDPRQRLRDIADVRHDLVIRAPLSAIDPIEVPTRRWRVPVIGVGVILATIAATLIWQSARRGPVEAGGVTQFRLALPSIALPTNAVRRMAISGDGRFIVYTGYRDGIGQIYQHRLDQLDPLPIRGTDGQTGQIGSLFLSPDGEWVGYNEVGSQSLKKVPINGGAPVTIYEAGAAGVQGPSTWTKSGTIIFGSRKTRGLMQVPATGGIATELTTAEGEIHHSPQMHPTGEVVLFTIDKDGHRPAIAALSLATGKHAVVVEGNAPRTTANGHLVFLRDGAIWAAKFNPAILKLTSAPALVVGELEWFANFDVADNGTLVYTPTQSGRRVVWVDRQGREDILTVPPQSYINPRLSPDGNRVILDVRDFRDEGDIWILDLRRASLDRLTAINGNKRHAIWTRDGTRIYFSLAEGPRLTDGPSTRARSGPFFVLSQRSDGTGTPERVLEADRLQYPVSFAADGERLVLREMGVQRGADWNLKILSLRDGKMRPLLAGDSYETNGEVSPDGKWMAYESEESSRREVYVRPFPDVQSARWLISTSGGREPLWSRNGRELFYVGLDGRLMRVDVKTAPSFIASTPVRLLNNVYLFHSLSATPGRSYDVSPDGSRFLMIKEPAAAAGAQLVVALNWAATLDK